MKIRGSVLLFICAVVAGLYWLLKPATVSMMPPPAEPSATDSPVAQNNAATTTTALAAGVSSTPVPAPPPDIANRAGLAPPPAGIAGNLRPAMALENISHAVRQYGEMFGGNPVGTNPEITAALNGGNPKQVNFIKPEAGMRINENGELVDAWGTPFFFHQLSGTETEIHSAGPDKIMWTADDLVAR
jgi:hypothetical protein